MKRRSFVKQSVSAAVLTPLAFSGLINAAGATEGGTENTTVLETTWFATTQQTTTAQELLQQCGIYAATHQNAARKFRYTRMVGSVMHLFCYEEWYCPVVEDGTNKHVYCREANEQTGSLEIDCGVYVIHNESNAACRAEYNPIKEPGAPWP